ncbi:TVP38/TMEM64 family protein [Swaminathania salitolerans]|uniref:TVP38/TMEM64 family membrane protein n=1 Tax=Swaminathania salitolerans TaxID=182838 RepID=A0A511BPR8_9PROT|nr:VTT domain-containing protein [Swaminathania salitolerans]GBQ13487.1 hypothetical protein AA21291_1517 [Swaminathania salitolerans LMG 21291]GEL02317.1 hypothetical protein SSA02_14800 [Swaminathania salitolerans]
MEALPLAGSSHSGFALPAALWKTGGTLVLLACLLLLAHEFSVTRSLLALIRGWKDQRGAPFLFLLVGIPYSFFGLPRQGLCLAAGLVFGTLTGFVLASAASLSGAVLGFVWIRRLASHAQRRHLQTRFRGRLALIGRILERTPFQAVLTLRLLPVGSAVMVTAAAGLYGVPLAAFTWATFLGALPQNLVFVLIGAGTELGQSFQIGLGILLFAGSSLLAAMLLARARREGNAIAALAEKTEPPPAA